MSGFRRTGTDPIAMARHWARLNRAIAWLRPLTSGYPWQLVRYEDFCADPEPASRRLLAAARSRTDSWHSKANHAVGEVPDFLSRMAMPSFLTSDGKRRCRKTLRGV
jgi:hypothetical protein